MGFFSNLVNSAKQEVIDDRNDTRSRYEKMSNAELRHEQEYGQSIVRRAEATKELNRRGLK